MFCIQESREGESTHATLPSTLILANQNPFFHQGEAVEHDESMTVCPPSLTAPTLAASIRTRKGHIRFFSPFLPPLSSFATPQFGPISSVAFHLVQCDKGYDRDVWSRYAGNLASQHGCLSTQVLTCMPSERAEQHDARWRTVGCQHVMATWVLYQQLAAATVVWVFVIVVAIAAGAH